jgi:hypothetical protein
LLHYSSAHTSDSRLRFGEKDHIRFKLHLLRPLQNVIFLVADGLPIFSCS